MASIAVKALAGLATAGTLGGGVYAGVYAYNNATTDTVENYLTKNGFTLIGESETAKWTKVLDAYKLEKNEALTVTPETTDGIKAWCNSALKKTIKSKEEADYEKATKLCVDFKNIRDKLGDKQLETTDSKLTNKLNSFSPEIKIEIEKIQIADSGSDKTGKQIKEWCSKNTKRHYSGDNETYYKNIVDNCLVLSLGG